VLDARQLVGVEREAVDHRAVEEQRAAAQAVLGEEVGERLDREPAGDGLAEVELEPAARPLGCPRQVAQLLAIAVDVQLPVRLDPGQALAHAVQVTAADEAHAVEGRGRLTQPRQPLLSAGAIQPGEQRRTGGVGVVFEREARLQQHEPLLG
jgi:hypothetical protein